MIYAFAAELVMVVHFLFIIFVVAGGALVLRWPILGWLHLPAFSWGFLVAANRWTCPLTPLEQDLRATAGGDSYQGGFIAHYLEPLVYPEGLPWGVKMAFAALLLFLNIAFWRKAWARRRARASISNAEAAAEITGPTP
jgi:hypothetical protein